MVIIVGRCYQIDFITRFELVFEGHEGVLRIFGARVFLVGLIEGGLEPNFRFFGIEFVFGCALDFDSGQAVVRISGCHFQ